MIIRPLTAKGIAHSIHLVKTRTEAGQIHFHSCQNCLRIPTKLSCLGHTDGTLIVHVKGARDEGEIKKTKGRKIFILTKVRDEISQAFEEVVNLSWAALDSRMKFTIII